MVVAFSLGSLIAGCAEPEPLTWRNIYGVDRIEIDRPSEDDEAINFDGSGFVYNAFRSVLINYRILIGDELGSIDEQVVSPDRGWNLIWRILVDSEREGGALAKLSIQPYDYATKELPRVHFFELQVNGNALPTIARGARMMLPLGRMFDASGTVAPGWYEAEVALSYSYRTERRESMTGVIGFAITEQAVREIVVPALTAGLAIVWNGRTESRQLQLLDFDDDGLVSEADVAWWARAQPNFDSDDDGEDDLYVITFGFRASRMCGGDDFGCGP